MAPQPPGAIKDGCRTASPSATWRTDPHTRQVPGAAPPCVPHGHHPTPGSRCGPGQPVRRFRHGWSPGTRVSQRCRIRHLDDIHREITTRRGGRV